jgi:hypothetical protein
MKIKSIRNGFQSDHSSTSYEFYAIDKPLDKAARTAVKRLSSRVRPTKNRASFIYHGDFSDLPGGWEPLVEKYYDVMYSESYDWWTLGLAFEIDPAKIPDIQQYAFDGVDDLGVGIDSVKNRIIIHIDCRMDPTVTADIENDFEHEFDEDEELDIETGDNLLNLLANNREFLKKGDYRLLYGIWKKYGYTEPENETSEYTPPEPPGMKELPDPVDELLMYMEDWG